MERLKEKSGSNNFAANLLIENKLYASSVHCSYYSFFQLLKYKMCTFFEISESELNKNIKISKTGSHKYIIDYVCGEFKAGFGWKEARKIRLKMNDLKLLRKKSDYDLVKIDLNMSQKAQKLSIELKNRLNKELQT